ncbi:VPS10 domain-containing protein [Ferruginibacter sp.]
MKKIIFAVLFLINCITINAQISSATFGMMQARQLGPAVTGGRISAIEGVNNEPRTLYIGTAGGGVWKTTNAGVSFTSVFDKYCQSIGALAIDQQNPKTIYVGTGESNMRNTVSIGDGLFKTTDGGDNWSRIPGFDSTEHISKVIINPKNSNIIYVACPGPLWSDSKHRGLYKSADGGKTFDKILYINEKTGCADAVIDPVNPEIIYASTWEFRRTPYSFNSGGNGSGMYKSTDGGKTWNVLSSGLPAKPFGRAALALAPSEPNKLLAIVEAEKTGLYISNDAGATWKNQSAIVNVVSRPFYFSCLVIDPKDAKRVYRPGFGFSYSDDGGNSFADGGFSVHSDMHALWINPQYTNQMYLGTDGGVYMSTDRGASWLLLASLPVPQFYHVAFDNKEPYNVYGGLQDNGSWVAPSQAAFGIKNSDWKFLFGGDGFWVQPDGIDESIVYAEYQGGHVNRVNTKDGTSYSVQPQQAIGEEKLRFNWNTPVVIGSKNKNNLYVASQYLYKSTTQGRSWQKISPDLTTNDKKKQEQEKSGGMSADNTSAENHCTIFTIAESPLDENIIWAGTDDGNLQYTTDGGKNWTNVAKNYAAAGIAPQSWVTSIEPGKFDKNTVYVTWENHMYGDHKTYAGKSTDMGKTFTKFVSEEFNAFAHKIKEDNVNKDLLFLATEMGLYATLDGGKKWFRMKNNIPWKAMVRDIQIHPTTNDLIIATHGRGILIVDNITAMRNMTNDMAGKEAYIFESKPINLTMGKYQTVGTQSEGWSANNTPQQAPIKYYFRDRLNTGDVKIEVYDKQGKLLQTMPGTKRKGINVVYWNMRTTPPKVASGGAKADFSGFTAPMVLPGEYTVKVKVADKVYDSKLELKAEEKPDYTLADREVQYATAMKLYNMHEQLAALAADVSGKQKNLKLVMEKMQNPKEKKVVQQYYDSLETLRGTLMGTKQASIFADEERIRENITNLYTSVCYQEVKPSNLQEQRVLGLQADIKKAEEKNVTLTKTFSDKVKAIQEKQQLPKSKVEVNKNN